MELQTPRGTKDLLPAEMKIREQVFGKLKRVVESYGFQPIETPAFESFELLAKKSGEQIKDEIYYFRDKGNREIALRFDGTVPVARVVASNTAMPKPIKFYYLSRFWRYDEPQAGRLREFWQLGIELIGAKGRLADAEVIACAVDCMKAVGLANFEVRLNSKKIVEGFARLNGIGDLPEFFRLLDKKEKISESTFFSELGKLGMDEKTFNRLANPEKVAKDEPKILEGLSELKELSSILLDDYGIGSVKADPLLVRGIDYYDGLVFEVKASDYKLTIAGGGRYDGLIGLYGPEKLPATGWAMGLERLMEVMKKAGKLPAPSVAVDVLVVPIDKALEKNAVGIANSLRAAGKSCDIELMGRNLGKSLEYASKTGIKFVVIVGKNEIANGEVVLKDMAKKTEEKVGTGNLVPRVQELMAGHQKSI